MCPKHSAAAIPAHVTHHRQAPSPFHSGCTYASSPLRLLSHPVCTTLGALDNRGPCHTLEFCTEYRQVVPQYPSLRRYQTQCNGSSRTQTHGAGASIHVAQMLSRPTRHLQVPHDRVSISRSLLQPRLLSHERMCGASCTGSCRECCALTAMAKLLSSCYVSQRDESETWWYRGRQGLRRSISRAWATVEHQVGNARVVEELEEPHEAVSAAT